MKRVVAEKYRDSDFSRARGGAVVKAEPGRTKISIRLDNTVIEFFRAAVERAGGGNYQTLINDALRLSTSIAGRLSRTFDRQCGRSSHLTVVRVGPTRGCSGRAPRAAEPERVGRTNEQPCLKRTWDLSWPR